jgi:hypothetical protein
MRRFRVIALLLAGVAAVAAGVGWTQQGDQLAVAGTVAEHQSEAAVQECSVSEQGEEPKAQSCQGCAPKHDGCGRVSCDPCCYRCPGDPILRCF